MKVYDHATHKRPKRRALPQYPMPSQRPPMPLGLLAFLNILGICIVGMGVFTYLQGRDTLQSAPSAPIEIAQPAATYGQITDGTYDARLITIIDVLPKASTAELQRETKEECFAIQHALWQHYPREGEIQVTTETPSQHGMTMVGVCTIRDARLAWDYLDAEHAWRLYDSAYFA